MPWTRRSTIEGETAHASDTREVEKQPREQDGATAARVARRAGQRGPQFVLHPADLAWPAEPVVGAERVHAVLRGWLAERGHAAYAPRLIRAG